MAIALTSIFGTEINVVPQPRKADRQYSAFPGVHGLTAMHLGSRGYPIIIRGTIRAATRPLLESAKAAIEAYQFVAAADYSFQGTTYGNVVWGPFEIETDSSGRALHFTAGGYFYKFVCRGRSLL